jgi:hypothetical protein
MSVANVFGLPPPLPVNFSIPGAVVTSVINGNPNVIINASELTVNTNTPESMILNNTTNTFSNELDIQKNGTRIVGFGNNNATNEAYVWVYSGQPLKFGTSGVERLRILNSGIPNDNTVPYLLGINGVNGPTVIAYKNNVSNYNTISAVTTLNLTAAQSVGQINVTNTGGPYVITLPAVANGLRFTFLVSGSLVASVTIHSSSTNLYGSLLSSTGIAVTGGAIISPVTNLILGAAVAPGIGDRYDLTSDGTNWYVRGSTSVPGSVTTS